MELSDDIYAEIEKLSEQGNTLLDKGKVNQAIAIFKQALDLVPAPKTDWEASTWLYATIGDLLYETGSIEPALDCFYNAYNCPGGIENPFVCLRLGECLFELNNKDKAAEFLLRAYMLEGEDIFSEEDEKYINLINDKI